MALLSGWLARCDALGVPATRAFSLPAALSSPVELREWGVHGLPSDGVSVENGVLVTARAGARWPLMIDPQEQGTR